MFTTEIYQVKIDNGWKTIKLENLQEGDIVRIFETDGKLTCKDGATEFKVLLKNAAIKGSKFMEDGGLLWMQINLGRGTTPQLVLSPRYTKTTLVWSIRC